MKKLIGWILLGVLLASGVFVYQYRAHKPPAELEVHFIDVGQGNATLIRTPDGKNMLIDAGSNEEEAVLIDYLKHQGIQQLDIVIATHPDEDHIGGMDAVIKKYEIGTFYLPDKTHTTASFGAMTAMLQKHHVLTKEAIAKDEIALSDTVQLLILNPQKKAYPNNNAYSIACKLTYGETSFLFTGDIEAINEYAMISTFGDALRSQVLQLSHHGSSSANSPDFIRAVAPIAAVVSCGYQNDYKHPNTSVLDTLQNLNVPLYRTDFQGNLVFFSDGQNISVNQERPSDIQ